MEDAHELNLHLALHGYSKMSKIDTLAARNAELERRLAEAEQARIDAQQEAREAKEAAHKAAAARPVAFKEESKGEEDGELEAVQEAIRRSLEDNQGGADGADGAGGIITIRVEHTGENE